MHATTLSALGEPNRLRIVELLRDQPYPVGEIAAALDMRQPQVSKHLRVLSEAGIVEVQPVAQKRVYYLQERPFQELESWLETFGRAWEARLDALDDFLQELQQEHPQEPGDQEETS
jgi:DNA-binding transcriptional ArsR family regulator